MTTIKPITSSDAHSRADKLEDDALVAAVAAGDALRFGEVALVVLIGLLVCPPLAIAVFLVVAPLLVLGLVLGLVVAIVSTPYLLVHHFRGNHGGHAALLAHRLRRAGRALFDLLPHRIVAGVRAAAPHR